VSLALTSMVPRQICIDCDDRFQRRFSQRASQPANIGLGTLFAMPRRMATSASSTRVAKTTCSPLIASWRSTSLPPSRHPFAALAASGHESRRPRQLSASKEKTSHPAPQAACKLAGGRGMGLFARRARSGRESASMRSSSWCLLERMAGILGRRLIHLPRPPAPIAADRGTMITWQSHDDARIRRAWTMSS
jgi:hypothetical protein